MMKNFTLLFIALLISANLCAQEFSTPDTGVNWTLDSLATHSPATVSLSNNTYTISQDLTVSKNDTLRFLPGQSLELDSAVRITVEGVFSSQGMVNDSILITATDSVNPYNGFRFEENSVVKIAYNIIKNGGGLKVITPHFSITNSRLAYNVSGVSTGGTISFSGGSPLVKNNTFFRNDLPAVSSPANGEVSAKIIDNFMKANNQLNENRPQINMGTTGSDTLKIIGNTIIGDPTKDQVGGIAVSNFFGDQGGITAIIKNNIIKDNRYGMTIAGGHAFVKIIGNTIENNDTQGQPNLGGSGISLNSGSPTQTIIATGNAIRGNLWGITVINQASINLGDDQNNPGNNVFSNNGNNGVVYALYNNTPNTIMAKHNCWIEGQESTLTDVAEVIVDQADDPSLGEVIYNPIHCSDMGIPAYAQPQISLYPNPAQHRVHFTTVSNFNRFSIFNLYGKLIRQSQLTAGQQSIDLSLKPGLYFIVFKGDQQQVTKKLVIK